MLNQIILHDPFARRWLRYCDPKEVICVYQPSGVPAAMKLVEQRVEEGLHAAGFLSYEAASGFDPAYVTQPPGTLPVLAFGVFESVQEMESLPRQTGRQDVDWSLPGDMETYGRDLGWIKDQIREGNVYQINYTRRIEATGVDAVALFHQIAHDAPYAALIDADEFAIVSASPELFFRLKDGELCCQPMKGTAARAASPEADLDQRRWLEDSGKNRAENLMITDMVRNDVGRIASPSTVRTSGLFDVQRFPTVWQMTSTVTAHTDVGVADVFAALFPPASITGAPKVASMQMIAGLEESPREIYTGAIGFLSPGCAQFNVAIRTAWFDGGTGRASYGVGGGIVWDSRVEEEYAELLIKARVLQSRPRDFELLETMLYETENGFFLHEYHMDRLQCSAGYFDFPFDELAITAALEEGVVGVGRGRYRIRLLLDRKGATRVELFELDDGERPPVRLQLAGFPVAVDDPFLHHKTTHRLVYEESMRTVRTGDDVLLWNEAGEVTESSIANLVYELDGVCYTPPRESGLLGGTYRQWLLDNGKLRERKLVLSELGTVERLYLINSVRGWMDAVLVSGGSVVESPDHNPEAIRGVETQGGRRGF